MSIINNFFNSIFQEKKDLEPQNQENTNFKAESFNNNSTENSNNNTSPKPSNSAINNMATNNIFYIRNIDIDELPENEMARIIVAVGSKNLAHYLALIVNLENRSRKISPEIKAKVLSSKNLVAPNEAAQKISKLTPILNSATKENVKK